MENFGWNFSASPYSEPECSALSSAAMVTAAEKVQAARVTWNHERDERDEVVRQTLLCSFPSCNFVSFVVKPLTLCPYPTLRIW